MSIPDWRAYSGGSRSRVALWLVTEVGEGQRFTKADLRAAFPAVEQVDRRMRDLRPEGWVIHTYREDRSLAPDELRLVAVGGAVWEKHYRPRQAVVSDRRRSEALVADGYACTCCGVGAGENYPDDMLRSARLLVKRGQVDNEEAELRTICERCNASNSADASSRSVQDAINRLGSEQLARLRCLMDSDAMRGTPEYALWLSYRRLPAKDRELIEQRVTTTPDPNQGPPQM